MRGPISQLQIAVFLTAAAASALVITGIVRNHALRREILDVPNERSSHAAPTPRGGGLAIASVVLVGILLLALLHMIPSNTAIAFFGGGLLVAGVGLADDLNSQSPLIRFAVQLGAATWAVEWLGGMDVVRFGQTAFQLPHVGGLVAILGITWLTNLYNFMDGIDGLAGIEAVSVGGIVGGCSFKQEADPWDWYRYSSQAQALASSSGTGLLQESSSGTWAAVFWVSSSERWHWRPRTPAPYQSSGGEFCYLYLSLTQRSR